MRDRAARLLNIGLRLGGLAAKLALSLYMGRYFTLADMGIYGLVFGAVMAMNAIAGMHIDYTVSRELTRIPQQDALHKMRDQAVFYFINYGLLAVMAGAYMGVGGRIAENKILLFILALTMAESFGNMTVANMNAMEKQPSANLLFFIRSGLWVAPVIAGGWENPAWRSVDTVLIAWLSGACLSIGMTFWMGRGLPWRDGLTKPIDWVWIAHSVRKSFPLWLGVIGLAIGGCIDRFIVGHFLGLDQVGILTFYLSFANALLALVQNGVLSFASPRLVALYRQGDEAQFRHETRHMARQTLFFSSFLAIGIALGVHMLALWLNRPALRGAEFTLWLIVAGIWIRANAETLYTILFARHRDRAIAQGNLLFLAVATGGNALLVPILGLKGAGCATLLSALFLFIWRWQAVRRINRPGPTAL